VGNGKGGIWAVAYETAKPLRKLLKQYMDVLYKSPTKLLYPELSYQINGILFSVFKEIGPGYREKHVQRAVADAFRRAGLHFQEQFMVIMQSNANVVGRYFLDFVIEGTIVLELKVAERFFRKDYEQVKYYLHQSKLGLGLVARFGRNGVKVERVVRPSQL